MKRLMVFCPFFSKKHFITSVSLLALFLMLSVSPERGFSITYDLSQEIDLIDALITTEYDSDLNVGVDLLYNSPSVTLPGPTTIDVGDIIVFDLTFANGQSIMIEDLDQPFLGEKEGILAGILLYGGGSAQNPDSTVIYTFNSYSGDLTSNPLITFYDNDVPFSPDYWGQLYDITDSSIIFDSISVRLEFSDPPHPENPIAYSLGGIAPFIQFGADNISIVNPAPVPEPSTILLLGAGLLGLAGTGIRKNLFDPRSAR